MKRVSGLCAQAGFFAALFVASLALAIAGQWFTDVYHSDLSEWHDEGPHFINGLMIHDYIANGFPGNPLDYALLYYMHYPRVTIGHWPPFFYFVQSASYFLSGPSVYAALFLQAAVGAGIAAIVGAIIGRLGGWFAGVLASIVTLAAPEIFSGIQSVMLDVPLTFLTCLAMLAWARFLLDETWSWSFAFAIAAAAAIMTKGNAIFLALLPPLSLAVAGRLRLLWNWRFWLPAPIVAVLTAPWYLATYRITAGGFVEQWGSDYVVRAVPGYAQSLLDQTGAAGILFAGLGAVRVLYYCEPSWRRALGISAICVIAAGFGFSCVVPAGIEGRYLAPLVPGLVILAYLGIEWIVSWQPATIRTFGLGICFLSLLAIEYKVSHKTSRGMNLVSEMIFSTPGHNPFILIGSTGSGEGAITAEIATQDRSRQRYVVRGFSALAAGNFMGTDYRPRFATTDDLAQWIERHGITLVVIDTSPASLAWVHNAQLLKIAQSGRAGWSLVGRSPNSNGETLLYKISVPGGTRVDHMELLSELRPARLLGH